MEQINLEVTQSVLHERHTQVVRDAEMRRMLQERRNAASRTTTTTPVAAPAPVRVGILTRLAGLLRPSHRRPALT